MAGKPNNTFATNAADGQPHWFLNTDDRKFAQLQLNELIKLRDEEYGIKQPIKIKRTKGSVPFQTRNESDIQYSPTHLLFSRVHEEIELSDSWYSSTFLHLFSTIKYFSQRYFGVDVFPPGFSPWKEGGFSQQFLRYATDVARPDPVATWDSLLMNSRQKSSLVSGIVTRVLMDTVFSSLLFGASSEHMALLKVHDEATLHLDGYKRTARRAGLVRDFLGDEVTTPRFWARVDQVASHITGLLVPLINLQGHAAPEEEWPELSEIHQQLFHIVAVAGYFSIMIRCSDTIIELFMPPVGTEWSHTQHSDDDGEYHNSRVAVVEQDDREEAKAKADKSLAEARTQIPPGWFSFMRNMLSGQDCVEYRRPIRTAKVKIAIFPRIKRYRTVCDPEAWNKWRKEQESLIFKSRVIYYYGKEQDPLGLEGRPSLADYQMTEWEQLWAKYYSPRHWALFLLLVLLFLQTWQPRFYLDFKAALHALAGLILASVERTQQTLVQTTDLT